jgi:single-strand DNA-binding protein
MADLNNLSLGGRLTRDPELRHTQSGTPIAKFGMASNGWKDDDVCFVDCTVFGKKAEALNNHFKKADPISITGRLKLDRWEKDGQRHQRHTIEVTDWHFGVKPKQQEPQPAQGGGWDQGSMGDQTPF